MKNDDPYVTITTALYDALYIGKYLKSHNHEYKKSKKIINKMLNDIENGNGNKYFEDSTMFEEDFDE